MALGTVFDARTAEQYLRENNRTDEGRRLWDSATNQVALDTQRAIENATYDYSTAMNEAYGSALRQKNLLAGENISGSKEAYYNQIDADLESAYQQYYENYMKNVESVSSSAQQRLASIQGVLDERAANLSSLNESMYDYLSYLYNQQMEDPSLTTLFEQRPWQRFLLAGEGDAVRLMTKDEFDRAVWENAGDNQYAMTETGTDIYDQFMNALVGGDFEQYSYDAWLSGDPDAMKKYQGVYEWSQQLNPYSPAGTVERNIDEFKRMVGMEANDYDWNYFERQGAPKLKGLAGDISVKLHQIVNGNKGAPKTRKAYQNALSSLRTLAGSLGFENAIDWETYANYEDAPASRKKGSTEYYANKYEDLLNELAKAVSE